MDRLTKRGEFGISRVCHYPDKHGTPRSLVNAMDVHIVQSVMQIYLSVSQCMKT